jgi:hypothetical protein
VGAVTWLPKALEKLYRRLINVSPLGYYIVTLNLARRFDDVGGQAPCRLRNAAVWTLETARQS